MAQETLNKPDDQRRYGIGYYRKGYRPLRVRPMTYSEACTMISQAIEPSD